MVSIKHLYYATNGKSIVSHQNTIIKGLENISINGILRIGVDYVGFVHNKDITFLNIHGRLDIQGDFSIGRGCRIDVGKDAVVTLGKETYINPFTLIVIMHELEIGEHCAISWNCQFLDTDFHEIKYEGQRKSERKKITIGNKVWIGSNVSIYKGVSIPNGCVIASNSVVKNEFDEENVLIAGNPAKIIKRNISW
jgi:acetyltransferase-like isoleucine patch superfamily enzyme